jgi:hypothetical protein
MITAKEAFEASIKAKLSVFDLIIVNLETNIKEFINKGYMSLSYKVPCYLVSDISTYLKNLGYEVKKEYAVLKNLGYEVKKEYAVLKNHGRNN